MPGYLAGRPPRNKGLRYQGDPPRVEEIVAVMRAAGPDVHGAHVGDRARAQVRERSSGASLSKPASGAVSRLTSSVTPTP